ncbi:MAG: hypothetical protein RLZ37_2067 [Actinomycetota bacterium]|jgi:hypothetical protein
MKRRFQAVAIAALASIGAGVVHGGAIGLHAEHPQLARMFIFVALSQIAWGLFALLQPSKLVLSAGIVINGASAGAWVVTRVTGISWIDGLEIRESPQWADSIAAGLGFVATGLALAIVVVGLDILPAIRIAPPAGLFCAFTIVALWTGVSHDHSHGDHAATPTIDAANFEDSGASLIDLSGFPGVTAEEQRRAEALIYETREILPRFATPDIATELGYTSIRDEATGVEHYINWTYINDEFELDPNYPESLVFAVEPDGSRRLVSAMYMLGDEYSLNTIPNVGGALTQWHIHDNLCFDRDPIEHGSTRVVGVTTSEGDCRFGMKLRPNPMLHVWLEPQVCGPFAALEGVGAGQVQPGEEHLCNTLHAHA